MIPEFLKPFVTKTETFRLDGIERTRHRFQLPNLPEIKFKLIVWDNDPYLRCNELTLTCFAIVANTPDGGDTVFERKLPLNSVPRKLAEQVIQRDLVDLVLQLTGLQEKRAG